jgi:nitrogen PTS system EIIA component
MMKPGRVKFADYMVHEAIVADLRATTKEGAIREIVRSVRDAGYLAEVDPESIVRLHLDREEFGSTGIGRGVAGPGANCRHPAVEGVIGTIALSRRGIDWDAVDGEPVHVLFYWISSSKRPAYDLMACEPINRLSRDERLLNRLRRAETREEIIDVLEEADRQVP